MHIPRPVAVDWSDIGDALPFSEQELLADVEKLRERYRIAAAYVGGSRADGYGNSRSDVDVYLLVDEPVERTPGEGFIVSFIRRQHIQYDFIAARFVEDAIEQLGSLPLEKVRLSSVDIKVLHRLSNSVVVSGREVIERYRASLRAAGFARLCAHRKLGECDNGIHDAYGAWESGHLETAVYMLRTTVQFAFDALVSLRGETANNDKWIFPRSVRAFGAEHPLCLRFRSLYQHLPDARNRDDVDGCFDRSFRFVQICLEALCADGLAGQAQGAGEPSGLSGLARQVLEGLDETIPNRKSPHVLLREMDGKFLLHHRGLPRQELSERAALIWLCIVGSRSPAEAATAAFNTKPMLFKGIVSEAQVQAEKLYAGWTRAGYLRF